MKYRYYGIVFVALLIIVIISVLAYNSRRSRIQMQLARQSASHLEELVFDYALGYHMEEIRAYTEGVDGSVGDICPVLVAMNVGEKVQAGLLASTFRDIDLRASELYINLNISDWVNLINDPESRVVLVVARVRNSDLFYVIVNGKSGEYVDKEALADQLNRMSRLDQTCLWS